MFPSNLDPAPKYYVTARTIDGPQYVGQVEGITVLTPDPRDVQPLDLRTAWQAKTWAERWRTNARTGEAWDNAPHHVTIRQFDPDRFNRAREAWDEADRQEGLDQ
jgi:hypothetical protein